MKKVIVKNKKTANISIQDELITDENNEVDVEAAESTDNAEENDVAAYEDFDVTLQATRANSGMNIEDTFVDDYDEEDDDIYDDLDDNSKLKDGGFGAFMTETFVKLKDGFKKNSKMVYIIGGAIVVTVIVIIIVLGVIGRKGSDEITESLSTNMVEDSNNYANGIIPVPDEPMQLDAYVNVNTLVNKYFEARQNNDVDALLAIRNFSSIDLMKMDELSQYFEAYQNIKCYTKKGPFDNSYIVYACYDVKIKNWDVLVPSELTLLVCSREDNSLYIYSGDMDKNAADYIVNISSQDDVVDLITRVNIAYSEVMEENPDLAVYITAMNQAIKDNVGEQLAAAEATVSESEVVEEKSPETEEGTETEEIKEIEVKTTTTVNVRASDSEQADKLGKAETGSVLKCKEQKKNGWTAVIFNGEIGYIKSDYLVVVGAEPSGDLPDTHGKVTAKDTINIRASADVDAEKVGIAYAGESFDLVNKGKEWTEIIYDGRVAYVKTEYVE